MQCRARGQYRNFPKFLGKSKHRPALPAENEIILPVAELELPWSRRLALESQLLLDWRGRDVRVGAHEQVGTCGGNNSGELLRRGGHVVDDGRGVPVKRASVSLKV